MHNYCFNKFKNCQYSFDKSEFKSHNRLFPKTKIKLIMNEKLLIASLYFLFPNPYSLFYGDI